jgi:hypothetical protein
MEDEREKLLRDRERYASFLIAYIKGRDRGGF